MERPKSASWMIPLMIGYALVSAALAIAAAFFPYHVLTNSGNIFIPLMRVNACVFGLLWLAIFWSAVGFVRGKRWSTHLGIWSASMMLPFWVIGLYTIFHFEYLYLSSLAPKLFGAGVLLSTVTTIPRLPGTMFGDNTKFVVFSVPVATDAVVLLTIIWFYRRQSTRAWIAAMNKGVKGD